MGGREGLDGLGESDRGGENESKGRKRWPVIKGELQLGVFLFCNVAICF